MNDQIVDLATPAKVVVTPGVATLGQTEAARLVAAHAAEEAALRSAGQRNVNLIWENTQSSIARYVVMTTLLVSSALSLSALNPGATDRHMALATTAFMLISNLVSLITGFYFGRTNHQRTGGVGAVDVGR